MWLLSNPNCPCSKLCSIKPAWAGLDLNQPAGLKKRLRLAETMFMKKFWSETTKKPPSDYNSNLHTCIERYCWFDCSCSGQDGKACSILVITINKLTFCKDFNLSNFYSSHFQGLIFANFRILIKSAMLPLTLLMNAQSGYQRACSVKGSCACSQLHRLPSQWKHLTTSLSPVKIQLNSYFENLFFTS